MEGHYDKTNYINGEDKTTERSRKNKKHSERPVGNVGYRIVALVLIFKNQLTDLVNTIFEKITSESAGI